MPDSELRVLGIRMYLASQQKMLYYQKSKGVFSIVLEIHLILFHLAKGI